MPACMVFGLLAPAAVSVDSDEEQPSTEPTVFAPLKMTKSPLATTIEFASGIAPTLIEVDELFSNVDYHAQRPAQVVIAQAVIETGDEIGPIVLASNDEPILEFFDAAEEPALTVDNRVLWNPAIFDVIAGTIDFGTERGTTFDDFVGPTLKVVSGIPPTPAVPEPDTGLLVGLGLLIFAGRRRR